MSRRRRKSKLPTEPVQVDIERLSHEGRGIAHIEGKVVFVADALPGETVLMQYTEQRSQFSAGKVVEVLSASPQRVVPQCGAYGQCGGCSLQHLSHADQVQFKQKTVQDLLTQACVEVEQWHAPLVSAEWGYRAKARIGVKFVPKKGGILVGFRERSAPYITDMQSCPVLHPMIGQRLLAWRELIGQLECNNSLPQLEIAVDDTRLAVVVRHLKPLSESDQSKLIDFARTEKCWLYLQPKGPDTIKRIWPEAEQAPQQLAYRHPDSDVSIYFQPQDFTQVNADINRQMVQQAINWLDVDSNDTVLDLFCGLGNFSLPLARKAHSVVGIEADEPMVARAVANAQLNHLDNVTFAAANLFDTDQVALALRQANFNKIVLDPPRAGAEAVCNALANQNSLNIVLYVSCQPSTLARDAALLIEAGFKCTKAAVLDMFPHTAHVETMMLFRR